MRSYPIAVDFELGKRKQLMAQQCCAIYSLQYGIIKETKTAKYRASKIQWEWRKL